MYEILIHPFFTFNVKGEIMRFFKLISLLFLIIVFQGFSQSGSIISHPEWSYDKTIYEVNLRQFTPSGSIKEFRQHLTRLKELGVGILWFMPIHPIGEKNRKGSLGSYYSVRDYKELDPFYGTKNEFKELVKEIHSMGMYVIIDWVANHTSWDNVWIKTNPEFYTKDSLGNFIPSVPDWTDVMDLNYDNKDLCNVRCNGVLDKRI
jgi:glycosidase